MKSAGSAAVNGNKDGKAKNHFTSEYSSYIESSEWAKKRELIKQRDGYACWLCSCGIKALKKEGKWLEVHHLTYARLGHEYSMDLITLCSTCHDELTKLSREISKTTATEVMCKKFGKTAVALQKHVREKSGVFFNIEPKQKNKRLKPSRNREVRFRSLVQAVRSWYEKTGDDTPEFVKLAKAESAYWIRIK